MIKRIIVGVWTLLLVVPVVAIAALITVGATWFFVVPRYIIKGDQDDR